MDNQKDLDDLRRRICAALGVPPNIIGAEPTPMDLLAAEAAGFGKIMGKMVRLMASQLFSGIPCECCGRDGRMLWPTAVWPLSDEMAVDHLCSECVQVLKALRVVQVLADEGK